MSNILGNMPPAFGSGTRGVVPAPTAADVAAQNILRADGTWGAGPSGTLPSQTGNSGKLLTTDGTNASWSSTLNGNLTVSGTGAVNGAGNIGALSVATTSETALAGPATWSNKHVLLGGVANGTAVTGYAVAVNQSNNDIYTFALAPGVAWRDIRHQAANHYFHNSGSTSPSLTISSTATTLAGNLTVSGTGTSSFAGNLLVTNSKFSFWDTGDQATNGYLEAGHFSNGAFIGTVAGTNAAADLVRFGTSGTERMRLNSSGNLLIAATVDSGNGKLQLATHTTSAGGIGFGTDTSLYRRDTGTLVLLGASSGNAILDLDGGSASTQGIIWKKASVEKARIAVEGSGSSLILYTGAATTALTLDSSQNATFAKKFGNTGTTSISGDVGCSVVNLSASGYGLRVQGGASGGGYIASMLDYAGTEVFNLSGAGNATFAKTVTAQSSDNATAGVVVKSADQVAIANWICDSTASSSIRNWSITTNGSSYGDLEFRSSNARGGNPVSAGTKVFSINSSGAISIGNTVTAAASVASTHKVTISIGGVTYYLLASNV